MQNAQMAPAAVVPGPVCVLPGTAYAYGYGYGYGESKCGKYGVSTAHGGTKERRPRK